jgi:hypothetical protein
VLAAWGASPARFREDANAEEDLVLGGYRDRVIVELAQNAADAAGRAGIRGQLRLTLDGDVLRAANTGAPIDAAGVESASTLRASSKRDDLDVGAVGRFGVGFAAVLAVSDEPAIVSRTGGVQWSRSRSRADMAEIPALHDELRRRGDVIPVLRLPYADESDRRPPDGYDTEVVVPLRDSAAVALARELLECVDAALLLTLPALGSVEIVVHGVVRRLVAEPTQDGVVVDGVWWKLHTVAGRLAPDLLRDRPVEEQSRREFTLTWAVPVDGDGVPVPLPPSVPAVAHAPTPTDEPLGVPALLIAPLPLDPTRRHVATGPLRDFLIERAAEGYGELLRELRAVPQLLNLVPVGVAAGALDGQLRARILAVLRELAFLPCADEGVRLRPSQALLLDDAAAATDEELSRVLAEVLPSLLPGAWVRGHASELAALDVRSIALTEVIDELGSLDRAPSWLRALYAALDDARVSPEVLAGLPVPLAAGGVARSPRGLLMPGAVGDLSVLGLRSIDPDAAHPLLLRLGALEADPAVVLTGERVRAAVENSYDAEDPDAIADAVLRLVAASGVSVLDHPWLAELALPADDGELLVAGELLLPEGKLAGLVAEDSPFGVVDSRLLDHWGAGVLAAVGVLDSFALVRAHDVVDPEHDLDGEGDYFDAVAALLDSDEPAVVEELLAVRDLELVRDDAWPAALRLLAAPPLRAAVVDHTSASTSTKRARVPSYTAWWLREHHVVTGRLASSDPLLAGLYDVVSLDLDDDFLAAVGALREVADADPDDLLARLADPSRVVTREQVRALYSRVVPPHPPAAVRAVRAGELVVVAADHAVVVDQPDLLPLLGNLAVVPAALRDAEAVADALDVALAGELGEFAVVSSGVAREDHVVHTPLMVADVDGVARQVPWRLADDVLHVDASAYAFGLGRGRAWRSGRWERRHLETELVRDPASASALLAEADLDSNGLF